jgi:hypothetical protein
MQQWRGQGVSPGQLKASERLLGPSYRCWRHKHSYKGFTTNQREREQLCDCHITMLMVTRHLIQAHHFFHVQPHLLYMENIILEACATRSVEVPGPISKQLRPHVLPFSPNVWQSTRHEFSGMRDGMELAGFCGQVPPCTPLVLLHSNIMVESCFETTLSVYDVRL